MIKDISSKSNETLKYTKSLLKSKFRNEENKYIIDGYRIVKQAFQMNQHIDYIIFCDEFIQKIEHKLFIDELEKNNVKLFKTNYKNLKDISDTENPQGILAVINIKKEDIDISKYKFILILDRIQDPGNMGTIIRTADAVAIDAIFSLRGSVDLYNQKVIRSTMGSLFSLPIIQANIDIIDEIKNSGFVIISSDLRTDNFYDELDYSYDKIALVIGNEANGICSEIIEKSNESIKIPIYGKCESLNASIASAILMYEIKKNMK